MLVLLREVAAGRVVDLEARILEQSRVPTSATFHSTEDAAQELRALLEGPSQIAIDAPVSRGERAILTVASQEHGVLVSPHVLVRAVHDRDGERLASVELLDDQSRAEVTQFLARLQGGLRRA